MPISLDTIVISNFKSFSGRTTIGPIHESFTAIIGRNGSGKSNIMDAISFALGERKSSALRVNCYSELIHGYTAGEPIKDSAFVKVIFKIDDSTKKSFTRKIFGEANHYIIDDKKVTNAFYKNELREMGLDIEAGNFLIPQDYIECFAMKKPKDLTAMFELISNSNAYKADYDRLKLELLKAEEAIHFEHQRKKQILIEKKYADMQKEETEKYLQLEKQYNKKKLKFQLIRLLLIKKKVESLQDEEREVKLQLDEYLRDKITEKNLLEHKKLRLKSLFNSLEVSEQDILKMEDIIQQEKEKYVVFEMGISHWQKKRDYARESLGSASKAHDTKKRIIQELEDELKKIGNKLEELRTESQTSTIELSNSQVKRYMELTNKAECQAKDLVNQINSETIHQQENQDKLENENRRKRELEDKKKQILLTKENLETRLKRLQDLSAESKVMEKRVEELEQKITETRNKSFSLENDIVKISEELSQADIDNNTISRQIEKKETIKILKQLPGVYGRLSDMCKPIHSCYNVAVTKVFGKNMDAIIVDTIHTATQCIQLLKKHKLGIETFLPLDSIKEIPLKEQLRTMKEPRRVSLLHDVLNISTTQINKAVLFVTKNTLVCKTIEDARIIAHDSDDKRKAYDCVTLDGCFYRKDGTMSGGQADLNVKAKQWEEQSVLKLNEQKRQLMQELRDLPKISLMQSELDIIKVQIEGPKYKNKYIEKDIKDTEDEIAQIGEELDMLDADIMKSNMEISVIQNNIQERVKTIKRMKKSINAIKDEIFVDFCEDINVPDISYYEKNNLRIYQEQKKRRIELEQQYSRIENQLRFENENDTKSKVLKWQLVAKQADEELNKVYQEGRPIKIKIEQNETEMSKLKDNYTNIKKDLENVEKELANHISEVCVIGKLYLKSQKAHIAVQRKIEQQKIECLTILNECKMEDFIIPMSETSHSRPEESDFISSSSSNTESSDGCKVLTKIDFSQFPENIRNCTKEDLQDMAKQLDEKLTNIQNDFKNIVNPNLKVDGKIHSIAQQIQEIDTNLRNCRNEYKKIIKQFHSVKTKRYELFSDCLEGVAAEIDSIYKSLVNDTSAQAIILPDNLEEPYAGNIIYNCIAPSKDFKPLQCLSGGEKSLASFALLFAIQRYKQIPFFIMDEADTSLDSDNMKKVIRFIQSQKNTMQFITISLHKKFYSNADMLVGVTTQPDMESRSRVFAISLSIYRTK